MVRKLKPHEQKLLKKTNFLSWAADGFGKDVKIVKKFYIKKREHYALYTRLSAETRELAEKLVALPLNDSFRLKKTKDVLSKLYTHGIIPTADTLEQVSKVSASSFARRRLPVVMKRQDMCTSIREASDLVEQGHVRVGAHTITDPAFLVTRAQEDLITWVDASKIRRHVLDYHGTRDDFDLDA